MEYLEEILTRLGRIRGILLNMTCDDLKQSQELVEGGVMVHECVQQCVQCSVVEPDDKMQKEGEEV